MIPIYTACDTLHHVVQSITRYPRFEVKTKGSRAEALHHGRFRAILMRKRKKKKMHKAALHYPENRILSVCRMGTERKPIVREPGQTIHHELPFCVARLPPGCTTKSSIFFYFQRRIFLHFSFKVGEMDVPTRPIEL